MPDEPRVDATSLIGAGFRGLVRPPFVWLAGIGLLGIIATEPIHSDDAASLVGVAVVAAISAYASIAITLAATQPEPSRSPEFWVRAALSRRCWLRSVATMVFASLLWAAGLLALIVPAFFIGAAVALSQTAAVLENHSPTDAIRRSIELSKPARVAIGIVYGLLVIVPAGSLQAAFTFELIEPGWLRGAAGCLILLLSSAAQISLTRAFLRLGGKNLSREEPAPSPARG